jgi:mRNA-degrading endonuclease RelE of RelBE toxin-antitoxin system
MSYSIETIPSFKKRFKKLAKKYPSLKSDLEKLALQLQQNPLLGDHLGNNFYKVRMAITSKAKGKSSGARIITHIKVIDSIIYLVTIFDKSEQGSISSFELNELLKEI